MSHKEVSAQESSSSTESSSEDETLRSIQPDSSDEDMVPYADEPLADSAWTAEYKKEMKENEELEKRQKHRLEGRVEVDVWWVFTEDCDGCHFIRFSRTKSTHFYLLLLASGRLSS